MATACDFFIIGDHEIGRMHVASALQSQGFTVKATPKGALLAERGSVGATVWLGALAGKNFHVAFIVEYMVDEQNHLVARLNRNMAGGVLKGGAIGASKTDDAFRETANAISAALYNAGILADTVSQG